MGKQSVLNRFKDLDPLDWKSVEVLFREYPLPGTESFEPGIILYDNTAETDHSVGKHPSTLGYIIVPLLDSLKVEYGNSISKAAKHALDHPAIKLRGIGTSEGVRAAYYAAKKKPPKVSLNMFGWFLFEADYEGAAMSFRYLNAVDRMKVMLALQEFSNRTRTES